MVSSRAPGLPVGFRSFLVGKQEQPNGIHGAGCLGDFEPREALSLLSWVRLAAW
jgi:hypothetical protein